MPPCARREFVGCLDLNRLARLSPARSATRPLRTKALLPMFLLLAVLGAINLPAQPTTNQPPSRSRLPAGVTAARDLEYGRAGGKILHLDLYYPEKSQNLLPLIIWIHGGAWRTGTKNDAVPPLPLTAEGYAVASVEYRLSQEAVFLAQIYDCKAAVRWLRANAPRYHLDPAKFAAWGASAGGHLAALLGTSGGVAALEGDVNDLKESSRVQAVVDWYGPSALLQIGIPDSDIKHNDPGSPESQLIGGAILEHEDKAAQASPVTYILGVTAGLHGASDNHTETPPFLIMHGDRDRSVPFNQSELLDAALKKAGADSTFIPVKGVGHGFSGPEYLPPAREFLKRCLK